MTLKRFFDKEVTQGLRIGAVLGALVVGTTLWWSAPSPTPAPASPVANAVPLPQLAFEGVVVEYRPRLGIGRQQDLKATIQQKAIDRIRTNPASHGILAVQHLYGMAQLDGVI